MHEYNLVPVVGFHSNGESVRVNFGIVPFAYEVGFSRRTTVERVYSECRAMPVEAGSKLRFATRLSTMSVAVVVDV